MLIVISLNLAFTFLLASRFKNSDETEYSHSGTLPGKRLNHWRLKSNIASAPRNMKHQANKFSSDIS
jgi:hypothetical protein